MAPNLSQISEIEGASQSGNKLRGNLHHKTWLIWKQFLLVIETTWKHSKGLESLYFNSASTLTSFLRMFL